MTQTFQSTDNIRTYFTAKMSAMYKSEVPAYGQLMEIVERVNKEVLSSGRASDLNLTPEEDTHRISQERHGAIRLGTAKELSMICRIFAVMGMEPVGYYDLSVASVPVHSTAFRPVSRAALAKNPFRVFTSLLRLELIEDKDLREKAKATLDARCIFTNEAIRLTQKAENDGGLSKVDATLFVNEVLETFRWHSQACVDLETFEALNNAHRLIADIVSFQGPHINHLTPRTLDIDAAQQAMVDCALPAKAIVEGPPKRKCPILLRQTAFKALNESVHFSDGKGRYITAQHTARFGEIEQRGVALTPKGRAIYDQLLGEVREQITPTADGSNAEAYNAKLEDVFTRFPDDWRALHDQKLAYFKYTFNDNVRPIQQSDLSSLLDHGVLSLSPIIYEDFLPVSAAGIFQSNLGGDARNGLQLSGNKDEFEGALKAPIIDEFTLYKDMQTQSLSDCMDAVMKMKV